LGDSYALSVPTEMRLFALLTTHLGTAAAFGRRRGAAQHGVLTRIQNERTCARFLRRAHRPDPLSGVQR